MVPLNQLLFWFIIKNKIPKGQGCNQADAMDQWFTNLMDRGEQLNLPAIMIRHITRIATTTQEHDLSCWHGSLNILGGALEESWGAGDRWDPQQHPDGVWLWFD